LKNLFRPRLKNLVALNFDKAIFAFILQSFLQKAVNSGAIVHREYFEGQGSVGLAAIIKVESILLRSSFMKTQRLEESLAQLAGYLDRAGEEEGWLVIFDPSGELWKNKVYYSKKVYKNYIIHFFSC
jgi:hypothetical protein